MNSRKRNLCGQFETKYPFAELESVKDYFLVKTDKESPDYRQKYANIRSSAYIFGKRKGNVRFSCKQVPEGIQVTRVQ